MKKLVLTSILAFAFCFCAFAQTNETSSCPTISIMGPSGIPIPNELINYSVTVDSKGKDLTLEYIWSVNNGQVVEGQGTQNIKIEQPLNGNLTVTVEVKGFPAGCLNSASESSIYDPSPEAVKLDEFTLDENRIDKARLDNLIVELQKDPTSRAYIIEKFVRKTPKITIRRKIQKITNHLKFRNQDSERFIITFNLGEENSTQFWIVPAGANPPKIKDN
jgi:hypothetical protein